MTNVTTFTAAAEALTERARLGQQLKSQEGGLAAHVEAAGAQRELQIEADRATLAKLDALSAALSAFRDDVPADSIRAPLPGGGDLERENAPELLLKFLRLAGEQIGLAHYGLRHRVEHAPQDLVAEQLADAIGATKNEIAALEQYVAEQRALARAWLEGK